MINIIGFPDPMQQIEKIVDSSNDIGRCDVLNPALDLRVANNPQSRFAFRITRVIDTDLSQGDLFAFGNALFHRNILQTDVSFEIRQYPIERAPIKHRSFFNNDLAGFGIYQIFGHPLIKQAVFNMKLFVDFITPNVGEIVPLRIKKTRFKQIFGVVNGRRFTRTQTLVNFQKRLLGSFGIVFF
ncbi:hypothetical protein KBTX_04434 [wastewater metagenome]|uniref:Uncharacterized protein n=2 Tax=unclassified sequences TaxID=12908 RepID=A0A5B8RHH1_9ZZZZ|nr:hypothetical protein KBTEX_04434 [uncultured organism]